jgi:hypothetical protein
MLPSYNGIVLNPTSQLFVISDGKSGLYRTLLSIWKLAYPPNLVTIVSAPEKVSVIEKSIYTVTEDTSQSGPPYEILKYGVGWGKKILEIVKNSQFDLMGFIAERDMFLPSYSDLISGKVCLNASYIATYRQRRRFGNSKVRRPNAFSERLPISSLVLHRNDVTNFLHTAVMYSNFECHVPRVLYSNRDKSEPGIVRILVQSNTRSPYDL